MVRILGETGLSIRILGEDQTQTEDQGVEIDPYAAGNRRRDESRIAATGSIPAEGDLATEVQLSQDAQNTAQVGVREILTEQELDAQTASQRIQEIIDTQETVKFSDYWELERQALAEKSPEFGALQALSALKFQYMVETLEDRIRQEKPASAGGKVASWFDRYVLRGSTLGALEGLSLRSKREGDKFAAALAGTMSFQDFQVFLDENIDSALEEGFFFDGNYAALQDLLTNSIRRGNNDKVISEFLWSTLDVAFPVVSYGSVVKTAKALTRLGKARTIATQAGLTGGHKAATEVAEAVAKVTDDAENLAGMSIRMTDPIADEAPVRPLLSAAQDAQTHTNVFNAVDSYVQRALGSAYDKTKVFEYVATRAKAISNTVNRPVSDVFFDYRTNTITARFGGFKTGGPVSKAIAERISDGIPEATIVQLDDAGKLFTVEIKEVVDMDKFVKLGHTPVQAVGNVVSRLATKVLGNRFTAGSYLRDTDVLTDLVQRAETGSTKVQEALSVFGKPLTKLSSSQIEDIGEVVLDLQSGGQASRRTWFTEDQFVDAYTAKFGKKPSRKVVEGYNSLIELSDYAYVTRASVMIRDMQRKGFRQIGVVIGDNYDVATGLRLQTLPDDATHVVEATTGRVIEVDKYRGPKKNIFKLDFEVGDGLAETRYVVDTDTINPLSASDVLGYNAGGSRINPEANFFVSFEVDGKIVRVAMSTYSQKEAKLAAQELQNLFDAYRTGTLTDDVVRANNSWHKMVETAADFEKVVADEGWDLTKEIKVNQRERDAKVFVGDNSDVFVSGGSLEEFALFSGRRNDKPLLHFGGARTYNDNPVNSVLNQVNSASRKLTYETYNDAAIASLAKAVKEIVGTQQGYSLRDYFYNMETLLPKGSRSDLVETLLERKRIFENRMGVLSDGEQWAQKYVDRMTESLYDLTGLKVKVNSPTGQLTKFGFFSTFFGDVFQIALQSSQAAAIVAMHPITGIKGMNLGRLLMKTTDLPQGEMLDLMIQRMSKTFDIPEQDIRDLRQAFLDIGRYEIDPENVAEGFQGASIGLSSRSRKLRVATNSTGKAWDSASKAGLYFFNKGEQISRVSAFGTAALEWRKINPNGKFTSEQALSWISNKEQALTLHMTQANKGAIQQGLLKVPTQFYSFLLRTLEGVFIGKNLTQQERIMLLAYMGPLWGLTGMGLSGTVDKLNESLGVEADSFAGETVRNGPIEAMLDWAFGGDLDIGLASRLSMGDAITDVFRSFQQESMFEVLAGAGGGKTGSALANVFSAFSNILTGNGHYGTLQLAEALREVKVLDNAAKVQGILAHDVYQSKTGKRIKGLDLSVAETIGIALGIPSGEVQDYYTYDSIRYGSNQSYLKRSKALTSIQNELWVAIQDGDTDRVASLSKAIEAVIEVSDLTEKQKGTLRSQVLQGFKENTTLDMYTKLLRMGLTDEAQAFSKLVGQ